MASADLEGRVRILEHNGRELFECCAGLKRSLDAAMASLNTCGTVVGDLSRRLAQLEHREGAP